MKATRVVQLWAYAIAFFVLCLVAPVLISEPDTLTNLLGLLLIVVYGVWSYCLWIKPMLQETEL